MVTNRMLEIAVQDGVRTTPVVLVHAFNDVREDRCLDYAFLALLLPAGLWEKGRYSVR